MLIRCGARPFGTRKSPLTSRLRPLWSSTALVLGRSDVPSGMLLCMFLLMLLCMLLCLLLCTLLYMLLCMLPCVLPSLTHPIPQSSPALSCLGTRHSPAFSCSAPQLGCLHFCSFLLTSLPLFAPSFAFLFRLIRCSAWLLFCSARVLGRSCPRPLRSSTSGVRPHRPSASSTSGALRSLDAQPLWRSGAQWTSPADPFISLTWLHFFISIDSLHAVCCTQVSISAAPGAKTPPYLTLSCAAPVLGRCGPRSIFGHFGT